ncbi:unnamed protein product, partial [Tetraodon nigroviridis]
RFRPTQTKTKKTKTETKLEFFGFEDKEEEEGEEGPEGGAQGKSSYKIKYFGFDDLSESDSDDESCQMLLTFRMNPVLEPPRDKKDARESQVISPKTPALGLKRSSVDLKSHLLKLCTTHVTGTTPSQRRSPCPRFLDLKLLRLFYPAAAKTTTPIKMTACSRLLHRHPKSLKSETIPTRLNQDIVTALKCRKEDKELYTVVQHVKHFNDVVEFGENQEFTDDFEYLETGLKSSQPLNTRCLSIISLATRCAMPGFRMHLRARGKVAQVFKILSDAAQHPVSAVLLMAWWRFSSLIHSLVKPCLFQNLALCTAALMYILSRDRLNMDLDRSCLELMIKLLEFDQECSAHQDQLTAKEVEKVKEKIRKLCETVHNKHLDLENITTGHLAMETLLSLTSKRAGDWFKEELRLLGGLDHIVDKVKECVQNLGQEDDKENLVASLWGAERCLRVLESVTVQNPENQAYLIAYKDSQLIVSSAKALRHCEDMIQRYSRAFNNSSVSPCAAALPHCNHSNVGKAVEDCMRAVIGVLLNLTHDNEWGSTKTGEQEHLMLTALNCVLRVPRYVPQEQRFDVRVLGLGLLINLVEYSSRNRHCLVDMEYSLDSACLEDSLLQPADPAPEPEGSAQAQGDQPESSGALAALVKLFLERERAAILAEAKTDDLISEAPNRPWTRAASGRRHLGKSSGWRPKPTTTSPRRKRRRTKSWTSTKRCSMPANTWRTASLPPTPPCCWAACARAASVRWAPRDRSPSRGSSTTWSTANRCRRGRRRCATLTVSSWRGREAQLLWGLSLDQSLTGLWPRPPPDTSSGTWAPGRLQVSLRSLSPAGRLKEWRWRRPSATRGSRHSRNPFLRVVRVLTFGSSPEARR